MPYIHIVTNTSIPDNTEEMLKTQLGRAIEILPGKNENWLMLNFTGDARLWFAGSDAPAALAEVSLYGGARSDAYDDLTSRITEILESTLDVQPDRIYVKHAKRETGGGKGSNFCPVCEEGPPAGEFPPKMGFLFSVVLTRLEVRRIIKNATGPTSCAMLG